MGATRRACNWKRQLPSSPNCPLQSITRSVCWFAGKSSVRTHFLVEPAGSERTRGRYGTNARFALAKRAMVRRLHLQGCPCGHGGGARIALPAPIHYTIVKSSDCPPRIGRKLFGRAVLAAGARAIFIILTSSVIPSEVEESHCNSLRVCRGASTPPCCYWDDNCCVMFDLLVGLANDQRSWEIVRRMSRSS